LKLRKLWLGLTFFFGFCGAVGLSIFSTNFFDSSEFTGRYSLLKSTALNLLVGAAIAYMQYFYGYKKCGVKLLIALFAKSVIYTLTGLAMTFAFIQSSSHGNGSEQFIQTLVNFSAVLLPTIGWFILKLNVIKMNLRVQRIEKSKALLNSAKSVEQLDTNFKSLIQKYPKLETHLLKEFRILQNELQTTSKTI
ncbi:MAG: hypothetical protein JHC93_07185, partial [Parachlamydiales bacterium]|nr:hypothetical protein [Parachlamydiales bacterium]